MSDNNKEVLGSNSRAGLFVSEVFKLPPVVASLSFFYSAKTFSLSQVGSLNLIIGVGVIVNVFVSLIDW